MARRFTEAEDTIIRERYARDGAAALAAELDRSIACVYQRVHLLGVKSGRNFTPEEDEAIRQRYPAEGSLQLAADLGRDFKAIQARAERLRVLFRNAPRLNAGRANVDVHFFDEDRIDQHSAYVLGYITADGCVQKYHINFTCTATDVCVLQYIKERMQSGHKIGFRTGRKIGFKGNYVQRKVAVLNICGKAIASILSERYGIVQRKTYTGLAVPPQIVARPDLLPHFVRGNFDGDGTVSLNKTKTKGIAYQGLRVTFLGSRQFLAQLAELVASAVGASQTPTPRRPGKSRVLYAITWNTERDTRAIYRWMYPQGSDYFCLERKRAKFENYYAERPVFIDQRKGEANARAALTEGDVCEIRAIPYRFGLYEELARHYGVSGSCVYCAYHRKTWKHIP